MTVTLTSPVIDFVRDNLENIVLGIGGLLASLISSALFTFLRVRA